MTLHIVISTSLLKIHGLSCPTIWHAPCLYHLCKVKKRMLKISSIDTPSQRRLVVEGKLVTPWASELKTACDQARPNLHDRELVVDVRNLIVISQEGENVLLALMHEGVRFEGCGVFTKRILRQLARRVHAKHQEVKP